MVDYKKELEEFTYIISHDLNAPLRHIREFSRLLVDRLENKANEEELEFLNYIEKSTSTLDSMLKTLLDYSRLNTHAENFSNFSFPNLIDDVLACYDRSCIALYHLPETLYADKNQIHLLFSQLIDNAYKFSSSERDLRITLRSEQQQERWLFSLTDNGIGLDPHYHERVFDLFYRLHAEGTYPGIGAGLPLAKKIVERHEGKIWIENATDQGVCVKLLI